MSCRLSDSVRALLQGTCARGSDVNKVPARTIFDAVLPLAPILGDSAALLAEAVPVIAATKTRQLDRVTVCSCVALLASGDRTQWTEAHDTAARGLGEALWKAVVKGKPTESNVECVALAAAKLYPDRGGAPLLDAAVDALRGVADAPMPLMVAIEIAADVTHTIVTGAADASWANPVRAQLVDAALSCAAASHRDEAAGPTVTRKVLIPLLQTVDAELRAQTHARAITLSRALHEAGRFPDAIVLVASLFEFLFPSGGVPSGTHDLRRDEFLWALLSSALRSVGSQVEAAAGASSKVPALHLKAVYLLKRLVAYTASQEGDETVAFHALFPWGGKASEAAWNSFFLIFDSLAEYGMHIVSPALERIPALASEAEGENAKLAVVWIELLVEKSVSHANSGARKLALGCLWSALPMTFLQRLSRSFVCGTAFVAGCDPRLCQEPDKVVLPGSFLDCKAFQGKPSHDLPVIQPVAERLVTFYTAYFAAIGTDEERHEACCILLASVKSSPVTHFGTALTTRLLQNLGRQPFRHALMSETTLRSLHAFIGDALQDSHPFWLESRHNAVMADVLLTWATPAVVRAPEFLAAVTLLSRGGCTGGSGLSAVDVVGVAGAIGTGLPHRILAKRIAAAAAENAAVEEFVSLNQLTVEAVDAFIAGGRVDAAGSKRMVALLRVADSAAAIDHLAGICGTIGDRTSMPPARRVAAVLLLSDVLAVTHGEAVASLREPTVLLSSVLRFGEAALQRAVELLGDEASCDDLVDDDWFALKTESFDAICAATFECVRRLPAAAYTACDVHGAVDRLVALAGRCTERLPSAPQEYARIACLRNALRLALSLVAPAVLPADQTAASLSEAWGAFATRDRIMALLQHPHPRLRARDVPTPLASGGWGIVTAQHDRTVMQLAIAFIEAAPSELKSDASFIRAVGNAGAEMLDRCGVTNMSAAFDITGWACRAASDALAEDAERWICAMQARLSDEFNRREGHRAYATLAFTLTSCVARAKCDELLAAFVRDEEQPDRTVCFLAVAMAAQVVRSADGWARFGDHLLYLAVFRNTTITAIEVEAALAASEPSVCSPHWDELRKIRSPSITSSAVGRAAAVQAVLYHAQQRRDAVLPLIQQLLEWNLSHPLITKQPCMPDSETHLARIRLWQLVCGMAPLLNDAEWAAIIPNLVEKAMEEINMGSVRRYIEIMTMTAIRRCPGEFVRVKARLADVDLRAQMCSSHTLVALHILKDYGLQNAEMRAALVPVLVRLAASNLHIVRLVSQIGLHDLAMSPEWAPLLPPEVHAIVELVEHGTEAKKFRERYLDTVVFDDSAAMQPVALFSTQRKEGDNWLHDAIPPIAFDRVCYFADEMRSLLGANSPFEHFRCASLLRAGGVDVEAELLKLRSLDLVPHARSSSDAFLDFGRDVAIQADEASAIAGNQESDNLQRKVTSWWNSEVHNELHPRALGTRSRQQLVIVGTLVEYPVNIAGLCRCAEIFAAEKIVVPDRKVFKNKDFVAVARSAELWLPWEEVPKVGLANYLATMRQLGYTIVGVEQTADSVPMQTYDFPERTVVVLGAEGTGIPANFLPCLDVCVEIPQFGLIRSLNVHVTGAVAMYEFTRQHLMESKAPGGGAAQ